RRGFAGKLRRLVRTFDCVPMGEALAHAPALPRLKLASLAWPAAPVTGDLTAGASAAAAYSCSSVSSA
ncbi:MAG TPA: hypothetical protein P5572_22080, partial [Phycisphaerae bacterium]|nr:hypothetical protein [Phycisphaerae bacterium]